MNEGKSHKCFWDQILSEDTSEDKGLPFEEERPKIGCDFFCPGPGNGPFWYRKTGLEISYRSKKKKSAQEITQSSLETVLNLASKLEAKVPESLWKLDTRASNFR